MQPRLARSTVLSVLFSATPSLIPAAHAQWEVETDPFVYLVDGYSAHLAYRLPLERFRLQLGVFGADVPEWLHGNDDFELRTRGTTLKVDYFFSSDMNGFFIGLDSEYSRSRYRLKETGETEYQEGVGLGPRVGYRFVYGENLYVTPWVSVRYLFNAEDVTIDDSRFESDRYSIFPTAHIGWRF